MSKDPSVIGFRIFPNKVKKAGLILLALLILTGLFLKLIIRPEYSDETSTLISIWAKNLFILGLFLIFWSEGKSEDEMTVHLRLKALSRAFGFAVIYFFLRPIVDLFFDGEASVMSAEKCLILLLLLCIGHFELLKIQNK